MNRKPDAVPLLRKKLHAGEGVWAVSHADAAAASGKEVLENLILHRLAKEDSRSHSLQRKPSPRTGGVPRLLPMLRSYFSETFSGYFFCLSVPPSQLKRG